MTNSTSDPSLFANAYEDSVRADSYAALEFPGTYYLAYRDLPKILRTHAKGIEALDFGCGTGRSTRFLKDQGFCPIGVDISAQMIEKARTLDPQGDYRLIKSSEYIALTGKVFDVILAVFTFDNIPNAEKL
jgi:ubiquinone/menaquinone biosynthesis C-methylase UbiE